MSECPVPRINTRRSRPGGKWESRASQPCGLPATTEIGLPTMTSALTRGEPLWIGPWCKGHAEYMRTVAPRVLFREGGTS